MKISSLYMKNFRGTEEADLTFDKGIILFSGDNGKGKSTAVYALSLLLFNYVLMKLSDYIRTGCNYFDVRTEFEHLGKKFKISFKYSKESSNRELYIDKEYFKNSDATAELAKYFEPKLSLSSIVSFEGSVDLIQLKPSERRENLKKIYDLDFKKTGDQIKADIANIELSNSETKTLISVIEQKEYVEKEFKKFEVTPEEKDKLSIEQKEGIALAAEHTKKIDSVSDIQADIILAKRTVTGLDSDITIKNDSIIKLDEALSSSVEPNWDTRMEEFQAEKTKDIMGLKTELDSIQKELTEVPALTRVLAFDEEPLSEAVSSLTIAKSRLSDKKIASAQLDSGICPVCGSEIDEEHKLKEVSETEELETLITKLNDTVYVLNGNKEAHKVKLDENNRVSDLKKEVTSKLEHTKELLDLKEADYVVASKNKAAEIESSKKAFQETMKAKSDNLASIKELVVSVISQRDSATKDLNKLVKDLEETNIEELTEKITLLEKRDTFIQSVLDTYKETEAYNTEAKKYNKQLIEDKKVDEKKVKELTNGMNDSLTKIGHLEKTRSIFLKEFPAYVISHMVKDLEYYMNKFIEETYEGKYKISIEEKKDAIYVYYGDGTSQKDVFLSSGYERQIFGLAWKHALVSIQSVDILILDEIDSQSSDKNSRVLYETIVGMRKEYSQLFIITHKEETKEYLRNEGAQIFEAKNKKIVKN